MRKTYQENSAVVIRSFQSGFSILEVLIFALLSSMVLIAISYATLVAVRTSQSSQNKTLSLRYVQQAQEWLNGQKEIDWSVFFQTLEVGTYCLNTIPDSIYEIEEVEGTCQDNAFTLGNRFKRELEIVSKNDDETELVFTIHTYWNEGKTVLDTQVTGLYALWE